VHFLVYGTQPCTKGHDFVVGFNWFDATFKLNEKITLLFFNEKKNYADGSYSRSFLRHVRFEINVG
jgi:hypothetical protein